MQQAGHLVGMGSVFIQQVVLQISGKLCRHVAHLGVQLGGLLTQIFDILRQLGPKNNDRLSHHAAVFGTTKTQDVHPTIHRHLFERFAQGHTSVGNASAIHQQIHIILMYKVRQILDFLQGINRPQLAALRNIHQFRLGVVLKTEPM